jgi:U3 small nucleolar RNA-associated protein 18
VWFWLARLSLLYLSHVLLIALFPHSNPIETSSFVYVYFCCVYLSSNTGVVNVYKQPEVGSTQYSNSLFSPLKSLMSLTTCVDHIQFNSTSELMLIASRREKDALRIVHVPTMSVFENWPTNRTPLHCINAVDFSPNSGMLAVGNDRGRVLLYRLNHYKAI